MFKKNVLLKNFLFILSIVFIILSNPAQAGTQLGPKTSYTKAELTAAVANSGLDASLDPAQMANLAMLESSGNAGIYNGSCCTGIFQLNTSNLASYGLTRSEYANMSLQEQTNIWADLTNNSMGASSVKTIKSMMANGETFDGQPVDSSLIMACIQMGTGHCQTMLNSGSCEGFSDKNGTNICEMAAKIRGDGSTYEGSRTSQNAVSNPYNNSLDGQSDIAANTCWACDAAAVVMQFNADIGDKLSGFITDSALELMATIFGVTAIIQICLFMLFDPKWNELIFKTMRFTLVMIIISSGTIYSTIITPYLLVPATSIGSEIGVKLSNKAFEALSINKPAGTCVYKDMTISDAELYEASNQVIDIVCGVNLAINQAIKKMQVPIDNMEQTDTSIKNTIVSVFLTAIAIISLISLFIAQLIFSFQIIEAVIRLGVYVSFSQYYLYVWIYKPTQNIAYSALKGFLYATMLLIVSGLLSAITVYIIDMGISAAGNINSISSDSANATAVIQFIVYTMASGLLAASIAKSAPSFAQIFSQSGGGYDLAKGAMNGISRGTKVIMGAAGLGVGAASMLGGMGLRNITRMMGK